MAIYKCKMCGGTLNIQEGMTVCECEYCGSTQTVPQLDNEKKINLFTRANRLRSNCEFDKASGVYESIIAEFPEEAEAYWGAVLCKYGIEYVDDPKTGIKIPTCHRSSFDSVMDDQNFDMVMEYSDPSSRAVYRKEAKAIEKLRVKIIEVSSKEEPYDIFICYKETDAMGERTIDSVIAQDVYDALTEKGHRVFFSRITLENKLGQEYEPYIFAALNSAKVMLVFGSDYEYFNAVWVKNEWSRFLSLMEKGEKKTLIPCYKGIDAYDMPKEFAKLQAQDMGKVGAIQDLLRGIGKILMADGEQPAQQVVVQQAGPSVSSMLKRGKNELEDGNWDKAKELFDQVLSMEPECSVAYLGLFMANHKLRNEKEFADFYTNAGIQIDNDTLIERVRRYNTDHRFEELELIRKQTIEKKEAKLETARKRFSLANGRLVSSKFHIVGLRSNGTVVAAGDNGEGECNVSSWTDIVAIAVDDCRTIGLKSDGTVVAVGKNENGECNVLNWTDIVAIVTGNNRTVGIKSDRTVVAVGKNENGECNVSDWTDIVEVAIGPFYIVGLKSDGTVVTSGKSEIDGSDWKNIVSLSTGSSCIYGIKSDGTVVSERKKSRYYFDTSTWTDIVAISDGGGFSVGLKSNGTVVAGGRNNDNQYNVSDWTDVVSIAVGEQHIVGLRSDGTVVATGYNLRNMFRNLCDLSDWTDIVSVVAGWNFTAGLKSDGTIVVRQRPYERLSRYTNSWKLFSSLDTMKQDEKTRIEATEKVKQELQRRKRLVPTIGNMISAGEEHTIGLRSNGTVIAVGNNKYGQCDVKYWSGLEAIAAGETFTVGLCSDGTVITTEADSKVDKECKGISAISAGWFTAAGLRPDGTVEIVSGDSNYNIKNWQDIIAVSLGMNHIVGLRSDGTVVATLTSAAGYDVGQCNVQEWRDVVAVSAGGLHTAGLRLDGTVIAVGANDEKNDFGQCKVKDWQNIVMVSAGGYHTVGLRSDGTVMATGDNTYGQCNVYNWKNIMAVSAGIHHTVGLCSDGTVVAVGKNETGACDVGDWKLFNSLDTLEQEIEEKRHIADVLRKREDEAKEQRLKKEYSSLQTELANLKGLFTGKRRKQIEMRLQEIKDLLGE